MTMLLTQFTTAMSDIGGFEDRPVLAVAVSGGIDSMALLLLTQAWASSRDGRAIALTVDHGLRTESAAEALRVADWCRARDIEHHILTWGPSLEKGTRAVQEEARNARYRLLTDWCRTHRTAHLLTAHHRGDQAETLFFRLARGSSIIGLACIAPVSDMNGIRLLRPLLASGKASLEDYLKSQSQPWIEDPSNRSFKYTRNVVRHHLQALPGTKDIEIRAAAVAEAFGRARAVLERMLKDAMAETVNLHASGAVLHADGLRNQPPEIARLLLSRLVQTLAGDDYPPRSEKIDRLYNTLKNPETTRTTLAHLLFTYRRADDCFIIDRQHAVS